MYAVAEWGLERRDGCYDIPASDVIDHGEDGYLCMVSHTYPRQDIGINHLRTALLLLCALHGVGVPAEVMLARVQPFDRRFMELLPTS